MKPKEYLKSGDIVKLGNGELYMYLPDYFGFRAFVGKKGYLSLSSYDDNLEFSVFSNDFKVNCIYRTSACGYGLKLLDRVHEDFKLVWKRESTIELSMGDIAKRYGVDKEATKSKSAERERLLELLAKKQSEKLERLSEEELMKRISELE